MINFHFVFSLNAAAKQLEKVDTEYIVFDGSDG